MKLIRETVENVKYLTEESENGKKHFTDELIIKKVKEGRY